MCFGYIARLSHSGGVGYFTRSNDFYLPSLRLEEGLGEWDQQPLSPYSPTDHGGGIYSFAQL